MAEKEVFTSSKQIPIERMIFRALSNGSTISAIGDYSSAVEQFKFTAPGRVTHIERMIVYIEDAGAPDAGKYGNNIVLTNGIKVVVRDSSDVLKLDLTADYPIKTNGEWGAKCYDVNNEAWGSGNDIVLVRWTFGKAGDEIELLVGDYLAVELNDDFSDLVDHRFEIQGFVNELP